MLYYYLASDLPDRLSVMVGLLLAIATVGGLLTDIPALGQNMPTSIDQASAAGPLFVHPSNRRYFSDPSGRAILLAGSHTWSNLQDSGWSDPPPSFDFAAHLDWLAERNHNFFRLWAWEESFMPNYYFSPGPPFLRSGPGTALDGKPKFDLTQFNQTYFDRLRARVIEAGDRGFYVAVVLFNGFSVDALGAPGNDSWPGHPFNWQNNINGLDGDPNDDNSGVESHTLQFPAITAIQEAYVRKVIDTVNDLDNVLYEISNESRSGSQDWQYHIINFIKSYQATLPQQHPVGMTVEWPGGSNAELYASPADWISPNGPLSSPPVADGSKVILLDTDHLCGICGDGDWVWKSFLRGSNPIFMDVYDGDNFWTVANGISDPNSASFVSARTAMGDVRRYAARMNLVATTPQGALSSTGFCLANTDAKAPEYLVYRPGRGDIMVDLSATSKTLNTEWFRPASGETFPGGSVDGGATVTFSSPFSGDAVLYLFAARQPNGPPVFTSDPPTSATQDALYNYAMTATDPDGDDLSFSATAPLPAWLSLVGHGDGTATLSGTPSNADVGSVDISLEVSDGTATDSQDFTVAVFNINDPPQAPTILSPPDNASIVIAGDPDSTLYIDWTNVTDPDGDPISYSWELSVVAAFDPILAHIVTDTVTSLALTNATITSLLIGAGVAPDESIDLYHRAVASDSQVSQPGSASRVRLTRGAITDVDPIEVSRGFGLHKNYPNPFRSSTRIRFELATSGSVSLSVFDVLGRVVDTLLDGTLPAGRHELVYEPDFEQPSGLYIYQIATTNFSATRAMTYAK